MTTTMAEQNQARQPSNHSYPSPQMQSSYTYPPTHGNEPYRQSPTASNVPLPPMALPNLPPLRSIEAQQQPQASPSQYYQPPPHAMPHPGHMVNYAAIPQDQQRMMSGGRHKKEIKRRTKTGCLTCRKRRIKACLSIYSYNSPLSVVYLILVEVDVVGSLGGLGLSKRAEKAPLFTNLHHQLSLHSNLNSYFAQKPY